MKDHMRYISKSDPTRFYDWVVDAANLYLAVNDDNSHESTIETSTELERALKELTPKEQNIVHLYINEDLTFAEISKRIKLSESQISRIYKQATKKIKTYSIKGTEKQPAYYPHPSVGFDMHQPPLRYSKSDHYHHYNDMFAP